MTAPVKFEVEHVSKDFEVRNRAGQGRGSRSLQALVEVDLRIADGEFLVIVGPSGCGKSTLLDLMGGLSQPTGGRILLDGKTVTRPGPDRGIVFQQYALLPWRTAQENVEFALEAGRTPKRQRVERAREYLRLLGLAGFEHSYPHQLSGGMKQRVAIARGLVTDPEVLLMDEPFGALDALTRDSLQSQLAGIWEQTGKTIVFVTHGIDEAVYLGQRVAVMSARPGRIKAVIDIPLKSDAPAAEVRAMPGFAQLSQLVWEQLRDEIASAQGFGPPPVGERSSDRTAALEEVGARA